MINVETHSWQKCKKEAKNIQSLIENKSFTWLLYWFMHHDQKVGKGLFGLHFHIADHHWKNSGQEVKHCIDLEVGNNTEGKEECSAAFL